MLHGDAVVVMPGITAFGKYTALSPDHVVVRECCCELVQLRVQGRSSDR